MIAYITLNHAMELDSFVTSHPRGHYMQTSSYGKSREDYEWAALALRDEGGRIYASISLLSRRVRFTRKRIFYAPRGPVFTTREDFRAIIQAARDYCRKNGGCLLRIDPPIPAGDSLFCQTAGELGFRFDTRDDYSTFQPKNVYQTQLSGYTEEELLRRFHPKTRYNIRLAQRRGVTIRRGRLSDLNLFYAMLVETARRDGFTARPEDFYWDFLVGMGSHARFLLAEKDGKALAAAIGVIQGRKAWYVWGCSYREGRENMPNYLLQWELIRQALNEGCEVYDFRGVAGEPKPENPAYGLHRFKRGFDGRFVTWVGQMDLVLCPVYCRILRWLQRLRLAIRRQKPSAKRNEPITKNFLTSRDTKPGILPIPILQKEAQKMIEQDTIRLLRECDAGVKMGIDSIEGVLGRVHSADFRHDLKVCKEDHENLNRRIQTLLNKYHDRGKAPNPITKTMSRMKTNVKLGLSGTDKAVADLMTDGCNMGIKSLGRYLNQYKAANEDARDIARQLIRLEEQLTFNIRRFL